MIAWVVGWGTRLASLAGITGDWLIDRSARINMTNLRQQVTLGAFIATTVVYLALAIKYSVVPETKEWSPGYDWLGFLALMSGLDATQFFAKRKTDAAHVAALKGEAPAPRGSGAFTQPAEPAK